MWHGPQRPLVPTGAGGTCSRRAEADVAAAALQGQLGEELSALHRFFYHVFAGAGQDDHASFPLSNMNYLDFQGIFLIHRRLFLSTERRRPREGEREFPKLFVGSARVGRLL